MSITGLEDTRQITVLLGETLNGKLISPQVIYQGKTGQYHPNFKFPKNWNITQSENHWSNETTMLEYADKDLIPYV